MARLDMTAKEKLGACAYFITSEVPISSWMLWVGRHAPGVTATLADVSPLLISHSHLVS